MNIGTGASAFIHPLTSTTAWHGDTARQRSQTLEAARRRHPTRFATTHDPKILDLPAAAWINQPPDQEEPAA